MTSYGQIEGTWASHAFFFFFSKPGIRKDQDPQALDRAVASQPCHVVDNSPYVQILLRPNLGRQTASEMSKSIGPIQMHNRLWLLLPSV